MRDNILLKRPGGRRIKDKEYGPMGQSKRGPEERGGEFSVDGESPYMGGREREQDINARAPEGRIGHIVPNDRTGT